MGKRIAVWKHSSRRSCAGCTFPNPATVGWWLGQNSIGDARGRRVSCNSSAGPLCNAGATERLQQRGLRHNCKARQTLVIDLWPCMAAAGAGHPVNR
jgi:hypothetical protein